MSRNSADSVAWRFIRSPQAWTTIEPPTHAYTLNWLDKRFLRGLKIAQDELHQVLEGHGVEVIQSVGQPFDPHRHEAVGVVDSPGAAEGTIVDGQWIRAQVLSLSDAVDVLHVLNIAHRAMILIHQDDCSAEPFIRL